MKERPSQYLLEKIQAFDTVLDFFGYSSKGVIETEKRVIFLITIDFWEWEIENLIYSCQTFKERSQAWLVVMG